MATTRDRYKEQQQREKERERRHAQFLSQFHSLEDSLDAQAAAHRKIAEAEKLLNRARASGLISEERRLELLDKEVALERERLGFGQHSVAGKAPDLSGLDQSKVLDKQEKAATTLAERLKKDMEDFQSGKATLEELNQLFEAGRIGFDDYATSFHNLNTEVDDTTQKLSQLGELGVEIGKTLGSELAKAFDQGDRSAREMVGHILEELAMLASQQLLQSLLSMTKNSNGASQAGASFLGSIIGGFTGKGGYATGGEAIIPGSGPPDSVPFFAMTTPGEHVQFTPPGRMQQSAQQGTQPIIQVHVVNRQDPRAPVDAMNTPRGARVINNQIIQDPRFLRRIMR